MNAASTSFAGPLVGWLADYYLVATLLLLVCLAGWRWVRQPAHRLMAAWLVMLELIVLAVVCALPCWPRVSLIATTSHPREAIVEPAAASDHDFVAPPPVRLDSVVPGDIVRPAPVRPQTPRSAATPILPEPRWTWVELLAGGYLIGSVMVGLWLCWGAAATMLTCKRAQPASDRLRAELCQVIHSQVVHRSRHTPCADRQCIPAEPHLAASPVGTRSVPSTCRVPRLLVSAHISNAVALGVFRPAIVLPAAMAESAPSPTLRAVLSHEWAHLRHRDLWLLALGRCLLAVLFVHPLFWWLRRAIRGDQELLADAVAAGEQRHEYAEELLRLVRAAGRSPVTVSAAMGIREGSSQLSRRIAMLLDETFRVEPTGSRRWRFQAVGVLVLLGAACSLPTLQPDHLMGQPSATAASAEAETKEKLGVRGKAADGSSWKATLANGATVELIGLSYNPSKGQPWWNPDGTKLQQAPYVNDRSVFSGQPRRTTAYEYAYRARPNAAATVRVAHNVGGTFMYVNKHTLNVVLLPQELATTDICIGAAVGPFEVAAKMGPKGGACERPDLPAAKFTTVAGPSGELVVESMLSFTWEAEYTYRLIVVGKDGVEHRLVSVTTMEVRPKEKLRKLVWEDRLRATTEHPLTAIKELRFEFQRYQFAKFKNVSLRPGQQTQVEVVMLKPAEAAKVQGIVHPVREYMESNLPVGGSPFVIATVPGRVGLSQRSVQAALNLTEEQKQKLADIVAKFLVEQRRFMPRVKPAEKLLPIAPTMGELQTDMRKLDSDTCKKMDEVLTPQQLQMLKDLKLRTNAFNVLLDHAALDKLGLNWQQRGAMIQRMVLLMNEWQRKSRQASQEINEKALAVLSPPQRAQLQEEVLRPGSRSLGMFYAANLAGIPLPASYPPVPYPSLSDEEVSKSLGLSGAQRNQVRGILDAYWPQHKELTRQWQALSRESKSRLPEERQKRLAISEKSEQLVADVRQRLEAVLTPQQRASYREMALRNVAINILYDPQTLWKIGATKEQNAALQRLQQEAMERPEQITREMADQALKSFTPAEREILRAEADRLPW